MKRYAVFNGDCYYPMGGWADLFDTYETLAEAEEAYSNLSVGAMQWAQLVDMAEDDILKEK